MRTPPPTADAYHLHALVEMMLRAGRSEPEIVAAVNEADDRPSRPARRPPGRWPASPARRRRPR